MENTEPIVQPLSFYEAMSDAEIIEELGNIQRDAETLKQRIDANYYTGRPLVDLAMERRRNINALTMNYRNVERVLRERQAVQHLEDRQDHSMVQF